ncbi:unnamed protein product, partial [Nesidiocoris tenuis]
MRPIPATNDCTNRTDFSKSLSALGRQFFPVLFFDSRIAMGKCDEGMKTQQDQVGSKWESSGICRFSGERALLGSGIVGGRG